MRGEAERVVGGAVAAPGEAPAVRVRRVEGAPVVSVRVWLDGGARVEGIPGLAYLTGRLLAEGTRRRSWRDIADHVEARGMMLRTFGSFESHGVAVDALADDWQEALELAAELVAEPAFPAERTAWAARQVTAELDSLADRPEVRTAWAFLEQIYAGHRRALPLQGTASALATLASADCAAFHLRALASGLRVTVAGVIDEEGVAARVEQLFATVGDATAEPLPTVPPAAPRPGGGRRVVELPAARDEGDDGGEGEAEDAGQAHLYLGHLTIDRRHDDFEALEVAAVVLGAGAGLTGRIPERIREREGLAYTATAHTTAGAGLDPGRLVVYVGTGVATVAAAETAARQELARLVADGPSAEEVGEAVAYLLGREPFHRETARQWADLLAEADHYRLPLDDPEWRRRRLERLTREEVAAAVARHLRPDDLDVTIGRPTEEGR
ncbi:MAG TPA: insulinase family protein [Thermoanaerobaculia bacterium]|nr:insulinase family protein [Thermoanaerobaculia bacterium]